ncbi:hypothetical protein [Desulfospira joergensenii]|uniref:hypothetical protein n=1 Tax=Desulfospira joergensenii TaxID=53329 RepID=UPI0003B6485B|nr:hypothetical protein [Desulfospira joergensenii]
MLKRQLKIGFLVLLIGLLTLPAWGSNGAQIRITDQLMAQAGGYGPGDGTGDGDGPADGTGNGPGDCGLTGVSSHLMLMAANGNAGTGDNGGYGPGDGTGDGDGPADGTGNGPGDCG